jgi:hypothetical protein
LPARYCHRICLQISHAPARRDEEPDHPPAAGLDRNAMMRKRKAACTNQVRAAKSREETPKNGLDSTYAIAGVSEIRTFPEMSK